MHPARQGSSTRLFRRSRIRVLVSVPQWRWPAAAMAVAGLTCGPSALPAVAQEAAATAVELPAVTVTTTARKRPEREKDVPVSVSSVKSTPELPPAPSMESAGEGAAGRAGEAKLEDVPPINSTAALARQVPNFNFVDVGGQSSNLINIRGVGSFFPLAGDDTSVVIYVDEAPQSLYGLRPSTLDVAGIEVLRGPQGTLYGRNTQGGAVNITSNPPTFAPEVILRGEIGSHGYGVSELTANGPLIGHLLAGRLAVRYSTYDGDIPNILVGGDDGALEATAVRGSLLFTPSSDTSATLQVSYGKESDTFPRFLLRDAPDFPVSAVDPRNQVDTEGEGVNFRFMHDFGAVVLNTVSTYQHYDSDQVTDLTDSLVYSKATGLPPAFFSVPGTDLALIGLDESIWTQEVRLSSAKGSAIAWTAGLNYFRSELGVDGTTDTTLPAFQLVSGSRLNGFTTDSYSAFGEVTVPLAERLKGTVGLRGTYEEKSARYRFDSEGTPGLVPSFSQDSSLEDSFMTGRGALSYDWTRDFTTYVSVASGYVSAGFPLNSVNNPLGKLEPSFPASTSWTYETGFKSEWDGGRGSLKGSLFFNDVKDGHLVVFDQANFLFGITTLDYQSYGGELEARATLLPGLDAWGGLGYTHAELVDVPVGDLSNARSGNQVPNVPEWTTNVGLEYRLPGETVGLPGSFVSRVSHQFVGARAADVANSFDLRSYSMVNARIGWEGRSMEIYGFAYNLFDERYEAWGQALGADVQSVRTGQGRILGIGSVVRF